jgi:cation diffusion facilitator CzcD-associated flavoprotein CzcO
MYRFQPSVHWMKGYPKRREIVDQIQQLWLRYGLKERTIFNTKVTKVYKNRNGHWAVNDSKYGQFDGVLVAVGTCGDPKMPHLEGQDQFKGEIYHSSELDGKDVEGKQVVIIGGGASAVEALEFVAATDAKKVSVLARVKLMFNN